MEGPNTPLHSPQGSSLYGGHSRNPSSIPPFDKQPQFSPISSATVSPSQSFFEPRTPPPPPPNDFTTQMHIPEPIWNDPGYRSRYVPVELQHYTPGEASSTGTPVPLIDPDGHHLPPRPFAPTPVSVPPMVPNGIITGSLERPSSVQQSFQAPTYRNPPAYPRWSATLPLPNRQPRRDHITPPSTTYEDVNTPILNMV